MQNKTMKPTFAAAAMLLLLALAMIGARNMSNNNINQRAKAGSPVWHYTNSTSVITTPVN